MILEQIAKVSDQRCPVARASLAITALLYQQFEVEKSDIDDAKTYQILESRTNFERAFRPLLLQWTRLHTAALLAFYRLWKETCATTEDFDKVFELVRVLVHQVVGLAPRTKEVQDVEEEMAEFEYLKLRELQMELLEQSYENAWGSHLRQVREELKIEALQFVKEQRIRCLLQGEWFSINGIHAGLQPPHQTTKNLDTPTLNGPIAANNLSAVDVSNSNNNKKSKGDNQQNMMRFVRLSHNRRDLHYGDFPQELAQKPQLEDLTEIIDLSTVSSVVSNVIPTGGGGGTGNTSSTYNSNAPKSPTHSFSTTNSSGTITNHPNSTQPNFNHLPQPSSTTKITIHGYPQSAPPQAPSSKKGQNVSEIQECVLLTLHPLTHSIASEWLDGLLMLLNQAPITAETAKLVNLITGYGLKIRLLNVRYNDHSTNVSRNSKDTSVANGGGGNGGSILFGGYNTTPPDLPSRQGVDDDYYYSLYV